MEKPQPSTKLFYDYHECRDYLQEKYGYDERDYACRYEKDAKGRLVMEHQDRPYLDFWHWVVDRYQIHNGCFISFSKDDLAEMEEDEEWIRTIYGYYLQEFANEEGELELFVWW